MTAKSKSELEAIKSKLEAKLKDIESKIEKAKPVIGFQYKNRKV